MTAKDWALIDVAAYPVALGGIKLVLTAPCNVVTINDSDDTVCVSVVLDREGARPLVNGMAAELDRQERRAA